MDDRLTAGARTALVRARLEARGLRHGFVGTEHLLLGLLYEPSGPVRRVLGSRGITVDRTRATVVEVTTSADAAGTELAPLTPRAEVALALANEASINLGHGDTGCEHILLGLLQQGDAAAASVLRRLDTDPQVLERDLQDMLTQQEVGG